MKSSTMRPHRLRFGLLLGAMAVLMATPGVAKRTNPPKVPPVVSGGVRYVVPNDDGRRGYVEAYDARTGRKLWTATLFRNRIRPDLEEDVQWVYIKTMKISGGKLIAIDERGQRYVLDPKQQAGSAKPVHLQEYLTGVPFLLPGEKLAIGWTEMGLPVHAFEKLYLDNGRGPKRVKGPNDLVGHVRVDTADKALRYVRLFTSPATVRASDLPVWLEVVPASKVDTSFVYGRTGNLYVAGYVEDLRRLASMKSDAREYGVVSDREWRASGLTLPTVAKVGPNFVVRRGLALICENSVWGTGIVQQVAETVSPDGRISREVLSKRKAPGILVSLLPEE